MFIETILFLNFLISTLFYHSVLEVSTNRLITKQLLFFSVATRTVACVAIALSSDISSVLLFIRHQKGSLINISVALACYFLFCLMQPVFLYTDLRTSELLPPHRPNLKSEKKSH